MIAENVSWAVAFGAGLLSFFSPCVLPLVPVYLFYISGTSLADASVDNRRVLMRTLGFVIGFSLVFMLMGTTASAIGRLFVRYRLWFTRISGVLLIAFGLQMLGVLKLSLLSREKRMEAPTGARGWLGSIVVGMAFAAGWTPCFGPILASILLLAGQSQTVGRGVALLGVYSLGMGIPFMLSALFLQGFRGFLTRHERVIAWLPRIGGAALVLLGTLLLTGQMARIASLLL